VFEWDVRKGLTNYGKHKVAFEEAATAFGDSNEMDGIDELHAQLERRRIRIARSIAGRILFVVYTVRRRNHEKEIIRIISVRQASRKERAAYAKFTD
jgi:uncharacterized DUF497 family protein